MMVPTIHLNGTSRDELLRQILEAKEAICKAVEALANAAPNMRDYYVQGPDAFPAARREHEKRMHRLADCIHELNEIAEKICAQGRGSAA
ncbi:MAG TPA: hypothetical protein VE993_19280 [Stellaceae bacterium]|nr:hypothetical protein [Stellaceae bacterium]